MRWISLFCISALFALGSLHGPKAFASVVVEYDLSGEPGDQESTAATNSAANVTGLSVTRSAGLNPTGAANSISANGWAVGEYFSFGFEVAEGFFADLSSLEIGTRASNTGPGFTELYYSGDGFTNSLAQIAQSGTAFANNPIDISSLTGLTGSVEFRLTMDDTVSANGGTVAGSGTYRITNYFGEEGNTGGFRVNGTVSAVPEPGTTAAIGLLAVGVFARRHGFLRKKTV